MLSLGVSARIRGGYLVKVDHGGGKGGGGIIIFRGELDTR